jgi:hypothetical protein
MEFLTWWFDKHYILSTIFTPLFTILWSVYYDMTVRAVVATIWWVICFSRFK